MRCINWNKQTVISKEKKLSSEYLFLCQAKKKNSSNEYISLTQEDMNDKNIHNGK